MRNCQIYTMHAFDDENPQARKRWIAILFGEQNNGTYVMLPMIFVGDDEEAVSAAAENWWVDEMTKQARKGKTT